MDQVVPADGVYAGRMHVRGGTFRAAVSVGDRPTFNGPGRVVEAYAMDYSGPHFYGEAIDVDFVSMIRGQVKFESVDALKVQMRQDVESARAILA